jgi:4-hydroxy-tetrahydrodipicolinate synthase
MELSGVYTALVTPFFSNGKIDLNTFEKIVINQLEFNIKGMVVFGTTGECPTLVKQEKIELLQSCVNLAKGKASIIANCGTNSTQESIEMTLLAKAIGADFNLAIVPYYNKPTSRGIIQHFHQLADTSLPLIIYHHPGRTGIRLSIDSIEEIFQHENIVGIKECSSDLNLLQKMKERIPRIKILSGNDDELIEQKQIGIDGVISVVAQLIPAPFQSLFETGSKEEYEKLKPLIQAVFKEVNPQGIKALYEELGYENMDFRLPMVRCEASTIRAIENELKQVFKYFPVGSNF